MAQALMFKTNMSADEIVEAARHAPGGKDPSAETERLGSLGSAEAARLLGKEDPGALHYGPQEPSIRYPDLDSELAKRGAEMAKMFKDAGLLGNNIAGGPGRLA